MTRPCSRIFLDTGCRLSEITNWKLADVDLEAIRPSQYGGRATGFGSTVYGEKTYKALDRYLRQLERERPERTADPDGWLWRGNREVIRTPRGHGRSAPHVCRRRRTPASLAPAAPHVRPRMAVAGREQGDLMALAGWKSRSMLDIYAKSAQVERAQAAGRRMSLGDRV